jgi:drug/metabolite transporter (DMT)-like permease
VDEIQVNPAYLFAFGATLCFALASVGFAHYARKISPLWMNAFKAIIAFISFALVFVISGEYESLPIAKSFWAFVMSGFLGLNVGDFFLMRAFAAIGTARTLIIFSFQPLILALFAFVAFSQRLDASKLAAVFVMIACVIVTTYEKFKKERRWEWQGPIYALAGVLLDAVGILLTRFAFDSDPSVSVFEGNFYRCLGAVVGFALMSFFFPLKVVPHLRSMSRKSRYVVLGAAFLGTVVSLSLYLSAVRVGTLATVTAIAGTSPLFAALLESIVTRKRPSIYLALSLCLFAFGFWLLFL